MCEVIKWSSAHQDVQFVYKVHQSKFLSTVIFNLDYVFFLTYIDKGNIELVTKTVKKHPFWDQPMIPLSHWLSATN